MGNEIRIGLQHVLGIVQVEQMNRHREPPTVGLINQRIEHRARHLRSRPEIVINARFNEIGASVGIPGSPDRVQTAHRFRQ